MAQEICLAVVNALGSYTIKGLSFRAFVYGIAAHKVSDAHRGTIAEPGQLPHATLPDNVNDRVQVDAQRRLYRLRPDALRAAGVAGASCAV